MGKCAAILQRFYNSKNHQKKSIQAGGLVTLCSYNLFCCILLISVIEAVEEFVCLLLLLLNCCRISELRRDLQAAIITKANLHIGPAVENYGGETFLSQEVAINIMQEYKLAFKRCEMVGGV